ncbi:MAG: FHA domain-containing protein [Planctomycetota bacterium]|jgi:hypothetical protein
MEADHVNLSIVGDGKQWQAAVRPTGTVIGRRADCGVVLGHRGVSGRHARMYMDPFGRWIVEDLGSRNGTGVDGRRVTVHALLPGQQVRIGPYVLSLMYPSDVPAAGPADTEQAAMVAEEADGELTVGRGRALTSDRLAELNAIIDQLLAVPSSTQLYGTVCRRLAERAGATAAMVRLPASDEHEADRAVLLACHAGDDPDGAGAGPIRLSGRVLRAVRSSDQAVMAASHPRPPAPQQLTAVDDSRPRNVYCAAVSTTEDAADVLYLEMAAESAPADMLGCC